MKSPFNNNFAVVFIFVVVLSWFFFAVSPPVSEKDKKQFQKQMIASNLLEYGETGKILKKLQLISPADDYNTETKQQNINDVISKAREDRKKWLRLEKYSRYKKKGVFLYLEMEEVQEQTPFSVYLREDDGQWKSVQEHVIPVKVQNRSFFLDIKEKNFTLNFVFANKNKPLKIRSIVLLKKKFAPIAFYDPFSYRHFLRGAVSRYTTSPGSFSVLPAPEGFHCVVPISFKSKKMSRISKYQKKQGNNGVSLVTNKYNPVQKQRSVSDEKLKEISLESIPVLSIDVPSRSLYSKSVGILANPDKHGREWERTAYIRYARNGEFVFDTFSGIRLQGGTPGRLKGLINFRLFFRKNYGLSSIESSSVFPDTQGIIKRLAVKQSEWAEWPFNSPLGYEITRQLGGLAPHTSPVLLYLNGKRLGLYYLVPHLGEKQVGLMFPDMDLNYFRWRGRPHGADYDFIQNDFWFRLLKLEEGGISEQSARRFFDIDNLLANLFAVVFSGTGDFIQGLILRDNTPEGKMFWYQWDMDWSFLDVGMYIEGEKRLDSQIWEKAPDIKYLFSSTERAPRIRLLQTLIEKDPDFSARMLRTMLFMLNHRLTDSYFESMLGEYAVVLDKIKYPGGDAYIQKISEYCRKRKDFLVAQIGELQIIPGIRKCTILAEGLSFTIDGVPKTDRYTGYHTQDESLSVVFPDLPAGRELFINKKPVAGSSFTLSVAESQNCQIQAELKKTDSRE